MTKTARQLKLREVKEQFTDGYGRIWSLQTRTHADGKVSGRIVVEFFARGVKGGAARWQMSDMASGPIDFVERVWKEYERDGRPKSEPVAA